MQLKLIVFFLAYSISIGALAQQSTFYHQYTLANPVLNPAYAGKPNKLEVLAGYHRQWLNITYSPVTNFVNAVYTHRGEYNYSGTHAFGAFIEQEKRGMFISRSFYGSYSYHLKLNTGYKMGFGICLGARGISLLDAAYSLADPALMSTKGVWLYPDIIPGFRLYSKKMSLDVSVRQLYKNKIQQGSKALGTDSKLIPHIYLTYCRKFTTEDQNFSIIPTAHVQSSIRTFPLVNIGVLVYYAGRVGLGATHTILNSFTGMLHVRITKESILGISYSYATNNIKYVSPSTLEIIFGFTPINLKEEPEGKRRVANCPNFEY